MRETRTQIQGKAAGVPGRSGEADMRVGLIAAFVLLILCFLGSSAYALYVSNGIGQASERIALNASPSVLRLASARTDLRRLESTIHRLLGREFFDPFEGREIERSMDALDGELASYRGLPLDPGEEHYAEEIETRRVELRKAVSALTDLAASDRSAARNVAETRITPLIDRLDVAMRSAADLNGERAHLLAMEILRLRQDGKKTELTLDALSALFGILLLAFVISALNRYTGLLEKQKQETEARANELDDFSGRVAHDVRGPLSSLSMALELASQTAGEATTRDMVTRAQRSLKRATDIVDGLYEFARSGAKPQGNTRCDAKGVLTDVVEDLRPAAVSARIELTLEVRSESWAACSAGVLSSIAGNLARNAIKYMGERQERRVAVRLTEVGEQLKLEVEDSGPGLPPAFMSVIFEPHARAPGTNQPGLGLGLATVKRLALAHGGTCQVESNPDKGCRFWVTLPIARMTPSAGAAAS